MSDKKYLTINWAAGEVIWKLKSQKGSKKKITNFDRFQRNSKLNYNNLKVHDSCLKNQFDWFLLKRYQNVEFLFEKNTFCDDSLP